MKQESGRSKGVGLLTTFNQQCGLATYAKDLVKALDLEDLIVLAEDVSPGEIISPDESYVRRVWKRQQKDFSKLDACIQENHLEILHLNCHYRFFSQPEFGNWLSSLRKRGIKVLSLIHNTYTLDQSLRQLCETSDLVVVHSEANRLELLANEVVPTKVQIVPHGVPQSGKMDRETSRRNLGLPPEQKMVVCFGFIQPHKGIDEVISTLKVLQDPLIHLYILGRPHAEDPHAAEYQRGLRQFTADNKLERQVHFIEGFLPDTLVDTYLAAADAIVMNYKSQHFESSGAVCRALSSLSPVIVSTAPTFNGLMPAVFVSTSGFPLPLALDRVFNVPGLRLEMRDAAKHWVEENSWENVQKQYRSIYERLSSSSDRTVTQESSSSTRSLKLLMRNRPNALSHAGGDTIVMQRIAQSLAKRNVQVDIDLEGVKNVTNYDLVHLFNFATPEITERHARACVSAQVPFVVTTMYEDLPIFYNQMMAMFQALGEYVERGQKEDDWTRLHAQALSIEPGSRWENTWTAQHAACLISTGERERKALLHDYPTTKSVELYRCGCDVAEFKDNGELFEREYGVRDFVLCVGRLETRKNQLQLLKALEDSDFTVVFATGGFTYQPDYEQLCRRFKRVGKTIFCGKLSREMLLSAYKAARIHALPSWYELPGLVSMEAARAGRNIVVADRGTPRDYFGNRAFYCDPSDPQSVYQAVLAAYYAPVPDSLAVDMERFSWEAAGDRMMEIYQKVLGGKQLVSKEETAAAMTSQGSVPVPPVQAKPGGISIKIGQSVREAMTKSSGAQAERGMLPVEQAIGSIKTSSERTIDTASKLVKETFSSQAKPVVSSDNVPAKALDSCNRADELAAKGKLDEARDLYESAMNDAAHWSRPPRSLGVLTLQEQRYFQAEIWFERAISCDPQDAKAWAGKGSAIWELGRREESLDCFRKALALRPVDKTFLPLLVKSYYAVNQLAELENILIRYREAYPQDLSIAYCLAGCYYKQQKLVEAKLVAQEIINQEPGNKDARELLEMLERKPGESPKHNYVSERNTLDRVVLQSQMEDHIIELENAKREKKYDYIIKRVDELLASGVASEEQEQVLRLLQAESFICRGHLSRAKSIISNALLNSVVKDRALSCAGVVALLEERAEEAKQLFLQAIELNPSNDIARAGLGHSLIRLGDKDKAWQCFLDALEINAENLRAVLGVIELGYARQDLSKVEDVLRGYLDYHPADLSILYSLAGCLFAQSRLAEAKSEVEKILALDPNHALSLELQNEIEDRLGEGRGNQI